MNISLGKRKGQPLSANPSVLYHCRWKCWFGDICHL